MSPVNTVFRTDAQEATERVLLVSAGFAGHSPDSREISEMRRLVESAGGTVVEVVVQKRNRPDPATFIGRGKALETGSLASSMDLSTLVFNHELSPGQVTRLEETTSCKVIDRTELILAIFAVQARTRQAKLRIELAQLKYMLPRLSGMWHHLDRLGAGIGTRGPGETQLEVDRRRARSRIKSLERKLDTLDSSSRVRRRQRKDMFTVALAGYTNAGKSTLLNRLCGAGVRSEDRLFATLDTTSRRFPLPGGESILISDTVGFIRDLPEMLLASFRSTLDAVTEADLILLVADASDPERVAQVSCVVSTLEQIGAGSIPRLTVWNKCDLEGASIDSGVRVSALTGTGIDSLGKELESKRKQALDWCVLNVDICTGEVEHWIRGNSIVESCRRKLPQGAEFHCGFFRGVGSARSYLRSRGVGFTIKEYDAHD